jgi:hypothetical protein
MLIFQISCVSLVLLTLQIFIFLGIRKFLQFKEFQRRQSYVIQYPHYKVLFDEFLEKSFDIIYKDRILVFSMEGTKPSEKDFNRYSVDFINLVLKLLGPNLKEELVYLYGNEETLLFTMAEYFNTRSEQDEIKQASIDKMMDEDNV